jgi:cellulose synthase/poly-beta-1,6-N-acetylglucosamine synthase-like glycosyltransferase
MIVDIIRVIIVLIGFFSTFYLFYKIPKLPKNNQTNSKPTPNVSIIIPCRNEEVNIRLLLEDLRHQTIMPHEIIVVDDDSMIIPRKWLNHCVKLVFQLENQKSGWENHGPS